MLVVHKFLRTFFGWSWTKNMEISTFIAYEGPLHFVDASRIHPLFPSVCIHFDLFASAFFSYAIFPLSILPGLFFF